MILYIGLVAQNTCLLIGEILELNSNLFKLVGDTLLMVKDV